MKPDGGKDIGLTVSDGVKVTDDIRVAQATIQGRARIVTASYDSAKLSTYSAQVEKSQRNSALADALRHFAGEAIDSERPLYGIFKAIEALTQALTPAGRNVSEGREALGKLVGHGKRYVDDIMQTSGLTRHHNDPNAQPILTDQECKERAKILIDAFGKTV